MPNETLTILTYNVYNHHEGAGAFAGRAAAIAAVVAAAKPDVVCVQEAPSAEFLRALALFLSKEQRRYLRVVCTGMRRPDGWSEHLGIIHPGTMRTATRHLSPTGENIGVSVLVAGAGLTVANVHLNPHDAALRRLQAAGMLGSLPPDGPAVLCGDLNAVPGGQTLAALTRELAPLAPPTGIGSTFPTGLREDLDQPRGAVLDHILWRGVVVEASGIAGTAPVDGAWPSDHAAVWARIRVES